MTYPPKIKKSRRGLLHDKLGIPRGEKIGEARLERAAHSRSPSMRSEANFALNFNHRGHHGTVTGIHQHGKNFARIEVTHGRRSPRKRGAAGELSPSYDDRPSSSIVVPKRMAGLYHMGQHVGVGAAPLTRDAFADQDADDAGADTDAPEDALQDYHRTMRGILTGNPIGKKRARGRSAKKRRHSGGR